MVKTYRDEATARDRRPLSGFFVFALISALFFAPSFVRGGLTRGGAEFLTVVIAASILIVVVGYRHQYLGICLEIRLDDDGNCELETRRRTIRIHARDIYAVRYSAETDDGPESYEIRFKTGKLHVSHSMTDFLDFLRQLKAFNPAVELLRFPAASDPALGEAPSTRGRLETGYIVRSLAFPAVVVILLVWLAVETVR